MNTWDESKRQATLRQRGLDFAHADRLFEGRAVTRPDDRRDYGATRWPPEKGHAQPGWQSRINAALRKAAGL